MSNIDSKKLGEYLALEIQMLHTDEIYKLEVLEKILEKKIDDFQFSEGIPDYNNSDPYTRPTDNMFDDLGSS